MENEKFVWKSSKGKTLIECLRTKDVAGIKEFLVFNRTKKEIRRLP